MNPSLLGAPPPAGRGIDTLSVRGDAGSVATLFKLGLPLDLLGDEIETAQSPPGGGEIKATRGSAPGEPAHALAENRNINPADELVTVIDGENEDTRVGTPLPLSTVGRAHVEVSTVRNSLASMQGMTGKKNE